MNGGTQTTHLNETARRAFDLQFDAWRLCRDVLETEMDDDLRAQMERARDMLAEASESLDWIIANTEEDDPLV